MYYTVRLCDSKIRFTDLQGRSLETGFDFNPNCDPVSTLPESHKDKSVMDLIVATACYRIQDNGVEAGLHLDDRRTNALIRKSTVSP